MSIIKMYVSTGAVTTVVSSQIDVPAKGIIRAITVGLAGLNLTPGNGDSMRGELSFLSTAQFSSNDARGTLCNVGLTAYFQDAARLAVTGVPFCVLTPIAVNVNAGERIYLHAQTTQVDMTAEVTAYLFIDDGIDVARPQVRRR